MKEIEAMFLDQLESEKFQRAISDDFSFADSLIDQRDLERINKEETE